MIISTKGIRNPVHLPGGPKMFNIFTKAKKPEATIGAKDSLSVEDCALRLFTSKFVNNIID